jgi:plasmid maintenance system antidote protein VapI
LKAEDKLLNEQFNAKFKKTGLSYNGFGKKYGLTGTHVGFLVHGQRGLSFWKAVRIANALGIDLGKIQKQALKVKR